MIDRFLNLLLHEGEGKNRKLFACLFVSAICIQLFGLSLLFFDFSIIVVIVILLGIPFLIFLLSSTEHFFVSLLIYLSILPLDGYCKIIRGFPKIGVMNNYLVMLFVLFLVYWIFATLIKGKKIIVGRLGFAIIIYVCIAVFSFFLGLIHGNKNVLSIGKNELVPQLMYLSFFVFLTTGLRHINKRILFDALLVITAIIGLQIIYAFPQNNLGEFSRIPTRNVELSLLAFPYVFGIIFFGESIRRKVISLFALLPISFGILVSLQRGLWLALGLITIISFFFLFIKRKYSISKIVRFLVVMFLAVAVLLIITVYGLSKLTGGGAGLVLLKRLLSFADISYLKVDLSAFQRTFEIRQVFSKLSGIYWFIGRGLGDLNYSKVRFKHQHYIDNSFAWLIWKMGIIGLIAFISIFVVFLQRAVFLFKCKLTREDTIYAMAIFLNILGLLVVSMTNASLVQYRFITFWAISMAMAELMYRKYKNENAFHMLK